MRMKWAKSETRTSDTEDEAGEDYKRCKEEAEKKREMKRGGGQMILDEEPRTSERASERGFVSAGDK